MPENPMLEAALEYKKFHLSVIPLEGKHSLIAWEKYQEVAPTADEIETWWSKWPNANVGIVTGVVSRIVVIDIDIPSAREELKTLFPDYDFDVGPRSRTRHGWHLFFLYPGWFTPKRDGVFPGVDVRGDGGYVVAPPSLHPDGGRYRWEVPLTEGLQHMPAELFVLIG